MLSTRSILSDLPEDDRARVRSRCRVLDVPRHEEVIQQGIDGQEMFIVESGQLKMSAVSAEGKELAFGLLGPGDTFGEMGMLDKGARSATVTALEPCRLEVLSRASFESLIREYPSIAMNLMVILAERLRRTTQLYEDTVHLEVPARLARFLLDFSHPGETGGEGAVLDVRLSQYELGTLVNASRESVNKVLKGWEGRGLIERHGGVIRILRPDELEPGLQV